MDVSDEAADLCEAGAYAEALATVDRALAGRSEDPALHTARGWALENLGRLPAARTAYLAALASAPSDWGARTGLANVLSRLGETEAAAALYRGVATDGRASSDPAVLELVGWSLLQLGRVCEAIEAFRRSLALEPDRISVHLDLGLALLCTGRPDEAAFAYDAALGRLRARPAERRAGPLAVATEDLDQALSRVPGLSGADRIRARLAEAAGA